MTFKHLASCSDRLAEVLQKFVKQDLYGARKTL